MMKSPMHCLAVTGICLVLAACTEDRPAPAPDAARPLTSLESPIGAACEARESMWCANYGGMCFDSICRAWCSAVDVPRCAAHSHEQLMDLGNGMACFCMPD